MEIMVSTSNAENLVKIARIVYQLCDYTDFRALFLKTRKCGKWGATGKAGNGNRNRKRDGNGNGNGNGNRNGKRNGKRETGNGNEKREIVLGSSPRFPNEYVTSQGRLGTRLL